MRRVLAITLLIALASPLLFALAASPPNLRSLPACCRKDGAHHCSGGIAGPGQMPSFAGPPCASYPGAVAVVRAGHCGLADSDFAIAEIDARRAVCLSADAGVKVEFASGAHPKRGPPAVAF